MDRFTPALEAVRCLFENGFTTLDSVAGQAALMAHTEIEHVDLSRRKAAFFRHFVPLRQQMVVLLADTYRKYFKLALAHAGTIENYSDLWAWNQLEPAVSAALQWMREWYVLACDGENQSVRRLGSADFAPGETVSLSIPRNVPPLPKDWRAPAWLFGVSLALFGVGRLKEKNIPTSDSERRLGLAHTRLLIKGARRLFLWELGASIQKVQNEETAAAGAIPRYPPYPEAEPPNQRNRSNHKQKGTEGLGRKKTDLSQYMDGLTEKQRLAVSLRCEYGLSPTEIASRMGIHRKTVHEHIKAAEKRIQQSRSREKRNRHRAEYTDE